MQGVGVNGVAVVVDEMPPQECAHRIEHTSSAVLRVLSAVPQVRPGHVKARSLGDSPGVHASLEDIKMVAKTMKMW